MTRRKGHSGFMSVCGITWVEHNEYYFKERSQWGHHSVVNVTSDKTYKTAQNYKFMTYGSGDANHLLSYHVL